MLGQVVEREQAFPLLRPPPADGEQPRQTTVACAIGRPQNDARGVDRRHLRPDDQLDPRVFRGPMRAHDSGDAFAVGHRQRGVSQGRRRLDQFLRMGGSFEEGEIRSAVQFSVAHGKKSE